MKVKYQDPHIEELRISPVGILCDSPAPGSNESITYEEWNI